MAKNKVIFLDRDGTINKDYGYVYKLKDLSFLPKAIEGLKKLYENNYLLIIITNQSGINRGYYTLEQYKAFNEYMLNKLRYKGIEVAKVYYCPHIDSDNCDCRKPRLGLFYQAIKEFNIDLENSFAIGDKERDLAICKYTKVTGICISENLNSGYIHKANLLEAANYILQSKVS